MHPLLSSSLHGYELIYCQSSQYNINARLSDDHVILETKTHTRRTRNGVDVAEDAQLKGRYEILHADNTLVIAKPDEKDAGTYRCSVPELNESKEFDVVGECVED